jgi:hypothetical protein
MTAKHKRIIADTLLPLNAVILRDGLPMDISSYTVKFEQEEDDGTSITAATATGITKHPTQSFTADTTYDTIKANEHGVKEDDQIVVANSGGALPTGLAASTRYYAYEVTPNTFKLSTFPGGNVPIDITGAGTGTHTFYVVGSVQYIFPDAAVDEAGQFRGWFTVVDGSSDIATVPDDELGIPIEIVAKGN